MEKEKQPELSLEYIISQLQDLDFEQNNRLQIQETADSLNLDSTAIGIVYKILGINLIIDREGVQCDLVTLHNGLHQTMTEYKKALFKSNSPTLINIRNRRKIQSEIDKLIRELNVRLIFLLGQKNGVTSLIIERTRDSVSEERKNLISFVLLRDYRDEVKKYLDKTPFHLRTGRRFIILTKLLADNPEQKYS
jgi:hypothetical protein